jgi:hypothetical protein
VTSCIVDDTALYAKEWESACVYRDRGVPYMLKNGRVRAYTEIRGALYAKEWESACIY